MHTGPSASPSCWRRRAGRTSLLAAVNNGADAVYAGMRSSTRDEAPRTSRRESLAEACRYAHLRGARVYLTANVLVRTTEMAEALATVACSVGGRGRRGDRPGPRPAARPAPQRCRTSGVHASTQINAHNLDIRPRRSPIAGSRA